MYVNSVCGVCAQCGYVNLAYIVVVATTEFHRIQCMNTGANVGIFHTVRIRH